MCLWVQQTKSAVLFDEKLNATVYTKNETEAVALSCGEVPDDAVATEWKRYISNQAKKILKIYNTTTEKSPKYYDNITQSKYGISKSVHTSLLIKNIDLSDTGYYICHTTGRDGTYEYTTMLHVLGKSLLNIFGALLDTVSVPIKYFLYWHDSRHR